MDTQKTVAHRTSQLCGERKITPNGLANLSAVPQATIKSILNGESKNPGVVTVKKMCTVHTMSFQRAACTSVGHEVEVRYIAGIGVCR